MPRVTLYVNAADKAFLDALPDGVTGAAILRAAIDRLRRQGAECEHAHQRVICTTCGHQEDADHVHTPAAEPAA